MKGKPLTRDQRSKIEAYYQIKKLPCEIARLLGVHHSTIYRELRKGMYQHKRSDWTYEWRYSADIAQQKHEYAQTAKGRPLKIGNDHEFAEYLENKIIKEQYSPAAALKDIKRNGLNFRTNICITTLYNYIDHRLFLDLSNQHLWRKSKQKPKKEATPRLRSKNVLAPSIEDRPDYINNREEFGHWEIDSIESGKGHKTTCVVFTERVTRKELIFKAPDKTAASVVRIIDRLERSTPNFKGIFKSFTMDNGCEFADWKGIERSVFGGQRTKVYFCHPYSSFERGSNENCNGIIRRFIPKGADIGKITNRRIKEIEEWINNYPRRIHDYYAADDLYKICANM